MESITAFITAIITFLTSVFSALPTFITTIKSKPDYSWIVKEATTIERSYDEYYAFYQKNYDYHRENSLKAENLKDVTAQYQAILDENLAIAKEWRKTPGKGQLNFYNAIVDNGMWDYKQHAVHDAIADEWGIGRNDSFSVYGVIMDWEIFGNLNFAFIGAAMGFTPTTMLTGGGLNEISHSGVKWEKLPYYFEAEDDFTWLCFGFDLYSFIDENYAAQAASVDNILAFSDPRIIGISMKIYESMNKA